MHTIYILKQRFAALRRNEGGLAYIEFAICITFLLLLFFGAIEITRYLLIIQKVEKSIANVSDVTARIDGSVTNAEFLQTMSQVVGAVPDMMNPYQFNNNGYIIISDVTQSTASGPPVVNWQYCGGNLHATSKVGQTGGTANLSGLPGNFTLNAGDEVILGEIFYNYRPITVSQVMAPVQLYRSTAYVPRISSLSGFQANTCQ